MSTSSDVQLPAVECWRFDDFEIDVASGVLRHRGTEVPLRRQTWQLLCHLTSMPGRLWTSDELRRALWPRTIVGSDSLVQCVVELRKALGDRDRQLIRTVARRGYRFDRPVDMAPITTLRHAENGPLTLPWKMLVEATGRIEVLRTHDLFSRHVNEPEARGEALAGVAMTHVILLLNRWSATPNWDLALAREAASEAIELDPSSARALHARAHVALLEGRHLDAHLGFRAALARNPRMARAMLRMGIIEMEMGRPARTAGHVRAALEVSRHDDAVRAQASFIQGMAWFHLGRDKDAAECMRQTLALRPSSGFAHQWLAAMHALTGDMADRDGHLVKFRELVPGHTLESLRATERSHDSGFLAQRERMYEGLRRASMI